MLASLAIDPAEPFANGFREMIFRSTLSDPDKFNSAELEHRGLKLSGISTGGPLPIVLAHDEIQPVERRALFTKILTPPKNLLFDSRMRMTDYVSLLLRIQQIQSKLDAVVEQEAQLQNDGRLSKLHALLKKTLNPERASLRAASLFAIVSLGIYYETGFKNPGVPIISFLAAYYVWQARCNVIRLWALSARASLLELKAFFISLSREPQSGVRYIAISIPIYDEALKISPTHTDRKDVTDLTTDDLIARALYQQHDPKDLRDLVLEFITSADSDEVLVRGSIREPSDTNHPND